MVAFTSTHTHTRTRAKHTNLGVGGLSEKQQVSKKTIMGGILSRRKTENGIFGPMDGFLGRGFRIFIQANIRRPTLIYLPKSNY